DVDSFQERLEMIDGTAHRPVGLALRVVGEPLPHPIEADDSMRPRQAFDIERPVIEARSGIEIADGAAVHEDDRAASPVIDVAGLDAVDLNPLRIVGHRYTPRLL